jgi:hypothetical protein
VDGCGVAPDRHHRGGYRDFVAHPKPLAVRVYRQLDTGVAELALDIDRALAVQK